MNNFKVFAPVKSTNVFIPITCVDVIKLNSRFQQFLSHLYVTRINASVIDSIGSVHIDYSIYFEHKVHFPCFSVSYFASVAFNS